MDITPVFIIGAQKSATSYLFRLLAEDSSIARAELKEPKIFSKPMYDESNFFSYFKVQDKHKYVLDGSTSYLHISGTAERVANRLGTNIPIIAVLRNPVERAVSGYFHEVKHGREMRFPEEVFNLPGDMRRSISSENTNILKAWKSGKLQPHYLPSERYRDMFFGHRYIANSFYRLQLEPWAHLFPNLILVDFNSLRTNTVEVVTKIREKIGLDQTDTITTNVSRNSTQLSLWNAFVENRALSYDHSRPGFFSTLQHQRKLISYLKTNKPKLPRELQESLNSEFDKLKEERPSIWL